MPHSDREALQAKLLALLTGCAALPTTPVSTVWACATVLKEVGIQSKEAAAVLRGVRSSQCRRLWFGGIFLVLLWFTASILSWPGVQLARCKRPAISCVPDLVNFDQRLLIDAFAPMLGWSSPPLSLYICVCLPTLILRSPAPINFRRQAFEGLSARSGAATKGTAQWDCLIYAAAGCILGMVACTPASALPAMVPLVLEQLATHHDSIHVLRACDFYFEVGVPQAAVLFAAPCGCRV